MILLRFIQIDIILFFIGALFIFLFKRDKVKDKIEVIFNNKKIEAENLSDLPTLNDLISLEKLARKDSSEIQFESLIGQWKFESVWKKGTDKVDAISSSLLRVFSATLELKRDESVQKNMKFCINNSIKFGTLEIIFLGNGELKGTQPLLPFYFRRIELKIGEKVLLGRDLPIPEDNDRPFFALIGMGNGGEWLSARGRGGGLALWLKG